jgi:hypothetical protein
LHGLRLVSLRAMARRSLGGCGERRLKRKHRNRKSCGAPQTEQMTRCSIRELEEIELHL